MYYHLIMDLIGFNGFMSTFLGFVAYDHREIIDGGCGAWLCWFSTRFAHEKKGRYHQQPWECHGDIKDIMGTSWGHYAQLE